MANILSVFSVNTAIIPDILELAFMCCSNGCVSIIKSSGAYLVVIPYEGNNCSEFS